LYKKNGGTERISLPLAIILGPKSVLVQQLGFGLKCVVGVATIDFDWSASCSHVDNPLANSWFDVPVIVVGALLVKFVQTPILYWSNIYNAKNFPICSTHRKQSFSGWLTS